jgi:Flp pilus assembly pilin Flp
VAKFWKDDSGQDSDYAMFLALVAVVLIAAFGPFRKTLAAKFAAAAGVLRIPTN